MGEMVWSAKGLLYGLVTLIEVGYDLLTGVCMLGLTRSELVADEIWCEDFPPCNLNLRFF